MQGVAYSNSVGTTRKFMNMYMYMLTYMRVRTCE